MIKRKPIIIIDDSFESKRVLQLFKEKDLDFVEYHIKKFEESCCGDLPTTKAPSVIAVEGIFKGEGSITEFLNSFYKNDQTNKEVIKNKHTKKDANGENEAQDFKIKKIDERGDSSYW